MSYLHI